MNSLKNYNVLAATAAVLSAGWVVAWACGWLADSGSWPVRIGLLVAGLALTAASATLLLRRAEQSRLMAKRYFDALCEIDVCGLGADRASVDLPSLPADSPWADVAGRFRKLLEEYARRTEELKHTRTAWEVRYHRAKARSEQTAAILSELDEPILAVDDYGEVVLANRSAEMLFQFDLEDAPTRALEQVVRCQKLTNLLASVCHHKMPYSRTDEVDIPDEDGGSRWYRVTATKLTTENAQSADESPADKAGACRTVAVLRDIGDQKVMQKRNAEFVSAVSHEMKTPLAGIKAYVELLADGDAEDEKTQEEFLSVINGQADRLQRLVDNMLNLARIEAGVVNVSKKTRSLNELLKEALHVVQPAAEAKRIEIVSEFSPMYLSVLADRDMLLQSAINLLSNAIKYTPEKGRVTLRSRLQDERVRFEVQDTGVGLSEEDCRRVFEKFYRVSKNKDMASGTGLGLPLAKHIVEDVHRGRLTAESTLGQGSTFAVTLPNAAQMT